MYRRHRRLAGALATTFLCATAACTASTTPPSTSPTTSTAAAPAPTDETIEQQLTASGFNVVHGSIDPTPAGSLIVTILLVCQGDNQRTFTIDDSNASRVQLLTSYVADPTANLVDWKPVTFATQPTLEEIETYDLCPHTPPAGRGADVEALYRDAGFRVVPGSLQSPSTGTIMEIDLDCPDDEPRWTVSGTATETSLDFRALRPGADVYDSHEFIRQPTAAQVRDLGLCYDRGP